jgi:hypothetical protein
MDEEVAEEHGTQCGGTVSVGIYRLGYSVGPSKTLSSCARLDSRWRLSLRGHVARELYYFSFRPATIIMRIAVASAYKCAVAAVG